MTFEIWRLKKDYCINLLKFNTPGKIIKFIKNKFERRYLKYICSNFERKTNKIDTIFVGERDVMIRMFVSKYLKYPFKTRSCIVSLVLYCYANHGPWSVGTF